MTGSGWLWVGLIAMVAGGLLSALFHSLKDMTRTRLEELAELKGNNAAARRIEHILDDVDGHSTAVALPRIVCNMIVAVSSVFYIAALRGETVVEAGPGVWTVVFGIVIASIAIWIFGLLIPHSVAVHAGEPTIYTWSWLIRACYIAQAPFRRLVAFFDEVVRRLAGKEADSDAEEIEAELMSVVEEGQEEGQFDQTERDMIQAVVEFRSTTVEQIMTPRTEIEAMELTNNLGDIVRFIRECHHSRIPVYQENLDHIVGVFYIRDLVRWLAGDGGTGAATAGAGGGSGAAGSPGVPPAIDGSPRPISGRISGRPFDLKSILRPALFVPETKTVRELLTELVTKKVHIAMVADEYGGTSGLVTLEDVIEEIFGEIQDEYEIAEDIEPDVKVDAETRTAEIDARAYIDDANDALRAIGVELPEGEDYDTVGGLIVTTLGRIPAVGESLRLSGRSGNNGGSTITIVEAEPTRVIRIRLETGNGDTESGDHRPLEEPQPIER